MLVACIGEIAAIRSGNSLHSRRLFYFYHVARLGSVSAAEAVLDIAQSALTRQLQQLEADLGELVALPLEPPLKRSMFLGRLRNRPVTAAMMVLSQESARVVRAKTGG